MNSIIVPNLEFFIVQLTIRRLSLLEVFNLQKKEVQKDQIPNLDLAYDMLPLMEMMEASDKSEFFYPRRTEDDWEKKIF